MTAQSTRGPGRPPVHRNGVARLPALAVAATLRSKLEAIAEERGVSLAEAHRSTLVDALGVATVITDDCLGCGEEFETVREPDGEGGFTWITMCPSCADYAGGKD